jgi:hypothetical protein
VDDHTYISAIGLKPNEVEYCIPLKYREMKNLYIVFWLFKDLAWCMVWRPVGIAMIFHVPIISVIIVWHTRHMAKELCHNLAE